MKCYITTFYKYDNYGTRLQNYAMCRIIQKIGGVPITILMDDKKENFINFIKDICSYLPSISKKQRIWLNIRKKRKSFKEFNNKLCFERINYNQLFNIDFEDSIAIAGSDQIWSPMHLRDKKYETELYFLRFAPKEKRYAYAPSFGVEKIPDEMKDIYSKYILDFQKLSVREYAGRSIINSITGLDALLLPDPVFLLSRKEWQESISESKYIVPKEKYILTYFLSKQSDFVWNNIQECAKKRNAKIINIAGNEVGKGDIIPAPDEFVNMINDAEAVFTDSFHGSVFSIIMHTPFLVFRRKDVDQFSRLDMLLNKYNLMNAYVNNEEEQMNYDMILENILMDTEKVLEDERKRGVDYLKYIIRANS